MINGQSLYWQIYDGGDQSTQSLEQLIQQDNLEKILEIKTISFEIRSENQVVLDYFVKQPTLKKLLNHMFSQQKTESTDRAIEVFSCTEALRNVFQMILTTPELIQQPFEALLKHQGAQQQDAELKPGDMAPPHIYQAFQKLFAALLMSPKRVQTLINYLNENTKYLKAWVQHIQSPQITEVLKTLILDFKGRGDDISKNLAQLIIKSSIIEATANFIISSAPLECVSNASSILCDIVSQNVPHLADSVIQKIAPVCSYMLSFELKGPELLRLHYSGDFVICCLSFMIQKSVQLYVQNENQLQKITYDIHQKRQQFMEKAIQGNVKVNINTSQKLYQQFSKAEPLPELQILGINEIDNYEKIMTPIFVQILNNFNNLIQRFEYMRKLAGNKLFGYGAFQLLQFIARVFAISADVKSVVFKLQSQKQETKPVDWLNNQVEENQITMPTDIQYGQLSLSAHAGCGGPSSIDISQTFKVKSINILLCIPQIIRKILQTGIIQQLVTIIEKFELNSNLHFVVSRIIIPLVEFGDAATDVSMYLFNQTTIIKNICNKITGFIPFKSRNSLQTFYITFARAFMRISIKLPDESAVEDKQKFVVQKSKSQIMVAPQHLNSTIKASQQMNNNNNVIYEFLQNQQEFRDFSQKCLEYEDEIPKAFGDARLTAEYAAAKKKNPKKNAGVFDAGFGNFGNFGGNDFFGFGGGGAWGEFGGASGSSAGSMGASGGEKSAKKDDGFGFGWGDFQ